MGAPLLCGIISCQNSISSKPWCGPPNSLTTLPLRIVQGAMALSIASVKSGRTCHSSITPLVLSTYLFRSMRGHQVQWKEHWCLSETFGVDISPCVYAIYVSIWGFSPASDMLAVPDISGWEGLTRVFVLRLQRDIFIFKKQKCQIWNQRIRHFC